MCSCVNPYAWLRNCVNPYTWLHNNVALFYLRRSYFTYHVYLVLRTFIIVNRTKVLRDLFFTNSGAAVIFSYIFKILIYS